VSAILAALRRLARMPGIRRLTELPILLRLSYALRAVLVRERRRFVGRELARGGLGVYHLRDSGIAVAIRHRTADVLILDELFNQGEYDPPAAIAQAWRERPPRAIVDLGANIGLFGAWALGRFPDARIVAFEPDAGNAAVHERAIAANAAGDRWELVRAAAATEDGTVRFTGGEFTVSHVDADDQPGGVEVPAVDVFPRLAGADFIKIDIEGSEWALLADPRFPQLDAATIVLEYHERGCPGPDPEAAAATALERAGWRIAGRHANPAGGAGVLWGVRG
jgi:FkbM family methyltransferase